MNGIVFRPARPSATCNLARQHRDKGETQPRAAYLVFIDGCLSKHCAGGLWCLGHAMCIECGMGVREGRLHYTHHPDVTPTIAAVTSR